MAKTGKLQLNLVDVRGEKIKETVDVLLRHRTLSETSKAILKPGKTPVVTNLHARPQGIYQVFIDPPSYQPVSRFVEVLSQGITALDVVCAVDPKKVRDIRFPKFGDLTTDARRTLDASDAILGFEGKKGDKLLSALDPIREAGFLNIMAKSEATVFNNGRSTASYFQSLIELRGDRFFVNVSQELREETKNSVQDGLFDPVSGLLHRIPDGFTEAGSFKTQDHYGNLQLTFCVRGNEWRADVDIDDAGGVEHVFQVLRNTVSGSPTHPYNIHQLLVHYQRLELGYDLLV
jgi:hypothetical protein